MVHLRHGGVSLVLDCGDVTLPKVLHWGADVGDLSELDLEQLFQVSVPAVELGSADVPQIVSVVPEESTAWLGTPGLTGNRNGRDFSTAFRPVAVTVGEHDARGGLSSSSIEIRAEDRFAGLDLELEVELFSNGLLRMRAAVTNTAQGVYALDALNLVLPVPAEAQEILDFSGRYARERVALRRPFLPGTHLRENRRARIHDGTIALLTGVPAFGNQAGEAWAIHVAFSGDTRTFAEQVMPTGLKVIGGGELLHSGEIRLKAEQTYTSPWVYGSYGDGIDMASERFHEFVRSQRPRPLPPRPVTINVWEAVYFDQEFEQLVALAELASSVGVERYVLDDGWFRNRRDDTAGLGDWYVDEKVWPYGLDPLIDRVRGLGMEFGLWFEPEMISPNSDLAHRHPDWILRPGQRLPVLARNQQVLNLTNPDAWEYVFGRLDSILSEYPISYVKWDHNRDLVEAGDARTGTAATHQQTLAVYRLIDELRARHPNVEIESCAGGGGRIDLEMLSRVERVWASDSNDALERQSIEAGTGIVVPPEMLGSHIGSPTSHTSGRTHTLDFRAATAFFGHLGIEWDLTRATRADLARLTDWVSLYKQHRGLLNTGTVVRGDHPDPAVRVHGIRSATTDEAIYAIVQMTSSLHAPGGMVRLPGLDPNRHYTLTSIGPNQQTGATWAADGAVLTGRILSTVGIQGPVQNPESATLIHATTPERTDHDDE
jgi:alpha-galactosidase